MWIHPELFLFNFRFRERHLNFPNKKSIKIVFFPGKIEKTFSLIQNHVN